MMKYFYLLEWAATLVENLIILCTIITTSGRRQQQSRQHFIIALSVACLTILVGFINSISAFSFLTPVLTMCIIVFILARILSTGSLLIRATAGIITYFVILTIDYILFALFASFLGWPENTFDILIAPGVLRALYLIMDKFMDILFYFLARQLLPKICVLKKKYQNVGIILKII